MTHFIMNSTYVRLTSGDIEIEHIREMFEDMKDENFKFSKWFARPALIDKKSGTVHLFSNQKFDSNYFDLDNEGWTHDHCQICSVVISDQESEYVKHEGYFDSWNWICKDCYETLFLYSDIEETLAKLDKYEK